MIGYWSKKSRPDMYLVACWKAMNRERAFPIETPIYEERKMLDRDTGELKTVRIQVGVRSGVNRIPAIRRRDLHSLATRSV